jgi:hypothetical protein
MAETLEGIEGVICHMDDVLVHGKGIKIYMMHI